LTIKENVLKKILQRKFVNKKQTQATFYVERNSRLSRVDEKSSILTSSWWLSY